MSASARHPAPQPVPPMARLARAADEALAWSPVEGATAADHVTAAAIRAMDRQFELSALFAGNAGYAQAGVFHPVAEAQEVAAKAAWAAARLTFFSRSDSEALCRYAQDQFPLRRRLAAAAYCGPDALDDLARSFLVH